MTDQKKPAPDAKPEVKAASAEPAERLHPVLTNEQFEAAKASARKKLEAERTKAAMKAVEEAELERLRVEEGLVGGDGPLHEMVDYTVDLAEYAAFIQVNMPMGPRYWHGHTYRVPRHVANSLAEACFRTRAHQSEIEGKSRTSFYQKERETVLSAIHGARNAPARFDA